MNFLKKYFVAFCCLCILTHCKKKSDCGCNADTTSTFTDTPGMLSYDSIEHKYLIYTSQVDGAQRNYICDSTIGHLSTLYSGGSTNTPVKFSAEVTSYCTVDRISYIEIRKNIRLRSISLLNP